MFGKNPGQEMKRDYEIDEKNEIDEKTRQF